MNKLNNDKEYTVLLGKLQDAKRRHSKQPERMTGIYLEIAEYMRNSLFLIKEAKDNYNRVILYGKDFDVCALDCSLAYRNLAEIAIDEDELDSAIEKISKSLEYAYTSKDPGLIQQALHQRAHICLSCELPEKALNYAEECEKYLAENSMEIDFLKRDGNSKCRLAHLQNLTAAIYMAMDGANNKKGLEVNEKAIRYASENNDWTLHYRCLLTKLNLSIGRERVQIAEQMCNISGKIVPKNADERNFRRESKCHLALERLRYCEHGNVSLGKKSLWKCFEELQKDNDNASSYLHEEVKKALIFIYKVEQRERKANSMNVKDSTKRRRAQMVIFEKIGDEASELELNEIALHFYQKMLKCADSLEDQRKAWCSMAETAKDCRLFERAVEFYKQARKKEEKLGYSEDQLLETDIAIAIISAEVESIPPEERLSRFEEVYAKCRREMHKRNILPDYIKFIKSHPNLYSKEGLEKLTKLCVEGTADDGNGEAEDGENLDESLPNDEFDAMNEKQIFFELKKEMKALDNEEKIVKERGNKNKHGESSLHEVARSEDYQRLKELVERGYDVNQLDHGGWTPLSEAISTQQLANVRLLLMSGADPNSRSTEPYIDDEQNKLTSTGLTPLMEACSLGNVGIARILLQFKARTSAKDDDDWTALEHLWEFLMNNAKDLDRDNREKLQKFVELLKQKQMEEGFAPRTYKQFLELVEMKKVASQRKADRKSSSNSVKRRSGVERRVESPPSSPNAEGPRTSRILFNLDDEEEEEEGREDGRGGEDGENEGESEDEETRNLQDYRKCITGLRNRRSSDDPEFSKTSALLANRKRSFGSCRQTTGSSAKKMFFK